jgi:hypothetical protein
MHKQTKYLAGVNVEDRQRQLHAIMPAQVNRNIKHSVSRNGYPEGKIGENISNTKLDYSKEQ